MKPAVSVIIPTAGWRERADSLAAAIDDVLNQRDVAALPIVVLNGHKYDPAIYESLRRRRDIRLEYREEGNTTTAKRRGRELVETPYFSFLDDDDRIPSDALSTRLQPMQDDPGVDVVVTNGYFRRNGVDTLIFDNFLGFSQDPLLGLADSDWLPQSGSLYRTTRITPDYFVSPTPHQEWTFIGFRLARERRIHFVDRPTFYYTLGSPHSISMRPDQLLAAVNILQVLLQNDMPDHVRHAFRRKLAAAHHTSSHFYWLRNERREAWRHHITSLCLPSGLRYLSYTRHLLSDYFRFDRSSNSRPPVPAP